MKILSMICLSLLGSASVFARSTTVFKITSVEGNLNSTTYHQSYKMSSSRGATHEIVCNGDQSKVSFNTNRSWRAWDVKLSLSECQSLFLDLSHAEESTPVLIEVTDDKKIKNVQVISDI